MTACSAGKSIARSFGKNKKSTGLDFKSRQWIFCKGKYKMSKPSIARKPIK